MCFFNYVTSHKRFIFYDSSSNKFNVSRNFIFFESIISLLLILSHFQFLLFLLLLRFFYSMCFKQAYIQCQTLPHPSTDPPPQIAPQPGYEFFFEGLLLLNLLGDLLKCLKLINSMFFFILYQPLLLKHAAYRHQKNQGRCFGS